MALLLFYCDAQKTHGFSVGYAPWEFERLRCSGGIFDGDIDEGFHSFGRPALKLDFEIRRGGFIQQIGLVYSTVYADYMDSTHTIYDKENLRSVGVFYRPGFTIMPYRRVQIPLFLSVGLNSPSTDYSWNGILFDIGLMAQLKVYVTIRSAEFMPENEIGYYLARVQSDKLQKGKAYIVLGGSSKAVDVEWSGRVANGMIEGSGTGVAMLENGQHYVISGKYINGIANGNCTVTQVTANVEDGMLDPSKVITKDKFYMVSDFINGYARYYKDDKWGFIDESAKVVVQPKYKKIVSSFDSDGEAIVLNDQDEEIKIDKHGSELGYSDHQNEIFAETRRKAELEEQERQRKAAEEARQRAEQEEKARIAAANAEKRCIDEIRNAKEGDRIVYCED